MGKLEEALNWQPPRCDYQRPADWAEQDLILAEAVSMLMAHSITPISLWRREHHSERTSRPLISDRVVVEDHLTSIAQGWPVWRAPDYDIADTVVAFLRASDNDLVLAREASIHPGTHRFSGDRDRYTSTVRAYINGRQRAASRPIAYLEMTESPATGGAHLSTECGVASHQHAVYAPSVDHLVRLHLKYSLARLLDRGTVGVSSLPAEG